MAQVKEESIKGVGGLNIFIRSWRPETRPRGVVMIVPGFNSHSGHYFWVAEQFIAQDLAVYAVDLRGRGRSDGERFYVQNFSEYLSDVGGLLALIKSREPGLSVYLLGHSAGGVISSVFTIDNQDQLAGLICEDFAFQVPAPDFALAAVKFLSRPFPRLGVMRLKNRDFSRFPDVVKSLNEDPLIANETQPAQTIAQMIVGNERLKREFARITLPVLILHGTADRVTKPSGSRVFYESAGSADKILKLYEGHFHDLLNDVGKEMVMADIQKWIDVRLAAQKRDAVAV